MPYRCMQENDNNIYNNLKNKAYIVKHIVYQNSEW